MGTPGFDNSKPLWLSPPEPVRVNCFASFLAIEAVCANNEPEIPAAVKAAAAVP